MIVTGGGSVKSMAAGLPIVLDSLRTTTYGVARMDKPKDYYRILGVARDASTAAIKRAYRRLAKKFHPDLAATAARRTSRTCRPPTRRWPTRSAAAATTRASAVERDRFEPLAWSFVRSPAAGDLRRPIRPGQPERRDPAHARRRPRRAACCRSTCPSARTLPGLRGHRRLRLRLRPLRRRGQGRAPLAGAVRIPAGVRDGTVFQVAVDDPPCSPSSSPSTSARCSGPSSARGHRGSQRL